MNDNGYIVAGWYTPDYLPWADKLRRSLDRLGEPHDIVQVEPMAGGWEANTMRKPTQILAAMDRHPGKTIVFLDVDCEVRRSLADLVRINADIATHMRLQRKSRGNGRLFARSGTLVLKPTTAALALITIWRDISRSAPRGYTDQYTLAEAIARTPELSIKNLAVDWCATEKDGVIDPAILHDSASKGARKLPGWLRSLHHITRARVQIGALQ